MRIYKKVDNLLEREIAGEVIIVESLTGMCHVLNETGSLIWKKLDEKSYDQITDEVMKQFSDATKIQIKNDVIDFLNELLEKNLIQSFECTGE